MCKSFTYRPICIFVYIQTNMRRACTADYMLAVLCQHMHSPAQLVILQPVWECQVAGYTSTHPSKETGVMSIRGGLGKTREDGLETGSSSGVYALSAHSACLHDNGGSCRVPEWRRRFRRRSTPSVLPGGYTVRRSLFSCEGGSVSETTATRLTYKFQLLEESLNRQWKQTDVCNIAQLHGLSGKTL